MLQTVSLHIIVFVVETTCMSLHFTWHTPDRISSDDSHIHTHTHTHTNIHMDA